MQVRPVKLVTALIFREPAMLAQALDRLAARYSAIDYQGAVRPFDLTDYYQAEMGGDLSRTLVSFKKLIDPVAICRIKHETASLEGDLSGGSGRLVNIDPGYLDLFKLVLASFKARGNKIYLGRGVYADMTAYFKGRGFQTFFWSFPDFKQGLWDGDLTAIREIYKAQLNQRRR